MLYLLKAQNYSRAKFKISLHANIKKGIGFDTAVAVSIFPSSRHGGSGGTRDPGSSAHRLDGPWKEFMLVRL